MFGGLTKQEERELHDALAVRDLQVARDVWRLVLLLIASGAPIEGIASIGANQVRGYDAALAKKGERPW